jgi:hypothetical protein
MLTELRLSTKAQAARFGARCRAASAVAGAVVVPTNLSTAFAEDPDLGFTGPSCANAWAASKEMAG